MASYGLSKPFMAKLEANGTYSGGFRCAESVSTSVVPNYNEAKLHGDNKVVENVTRFKDAAVTCGVTTLPAIAKKTLFGHGISEEGVEASKTGDASNYVGYGFISAELVNGVNKFIACILPKVMFKEGEEAYETNGDSIVFKTPTLSGVAFGTTDENWRIKKEFGLEEEAEEWIKVKLNIKESCKNVIFSVEAGSYAEVQNLTLSCETTGATIKYTTDGTTPSAENGTAYANKAVVINANVGIRAVATKANCENSEVVTKEYFVTVV